ETATITEIAKQLAQEEELGFEAEQISARRIGRVFGRMRLKEQPRSGSGGKRQWRLSKGELRKWLLSYGIPLPERLFADASIPTSAPPAPHDADDEDTPEEGAAPWDLGGDDTPPPNGANGVDGANGAALAAQPGSPQCASVTDHNTRNSASHQDC